MKETYKKYELLCKDVKYQIDFIDDYHEFDFQELEETLNQMKTLQDNINDVDKKYYIQDSRSYVGNSCVFWAKNNNGYTTKLEKAECYTKKEALYKSQNRSTDIPISKDCIYKSKSYQVDIQDLRRVKDKTG